MRIIFLGLSITSSWGNGHATNYRALVRALGRRGHDTLFLERDVPWYACHRDAPGAAVLYGSADELRWRHEDAVRDADLVVVGSYVPDGVEVGEWVLETADGATAFYDLDTPVTLAKLDAGDEEYLSPELVPRFDLYLSFSAGPALERLEHDYGALRARAFHCLVDAEAYRPLPARRDLDLGYLGTYSEGRQSALERLLLDPAHWAPARRFAVAGPQYPETIAWPANVERIEHLPPDEHPAFLARQRFTLDVTRADMVAAGWSPSVRLIEAAACGVPVITDPWEGLEAFFVPGREILVAHCADDVLDYLALPDGERDAIGRRARERVLRKHTAAHRARELERHVAALSDVKPKRAARPPLVEVVSAATFETTAYGRSRSA
ncbi:MAG TPA: glycosyltransferase [Gaiellaceae bacterium]|nr:glycosyltransferase [Gaiellaceae bacterium]